MRSAMRLGAIVAVLVVLLAGGQAAAEDAYPVYNGHSYGYFAAREISWDDANAAAGAAVLDGCYEGYLAAVTSAEENAFLHEQFGWIYPVGAWIGGYQDPGVVPADYGWQWVTGEAWGYTNWDAGEPNDGPGVPASEQHLMMLATGFWNDGETLGHIYGYIVECDRVQPVLIDIKPGSYPNSFNANGNGVIPIAILGSADLDVADVDPSTLSFEGALVRVKGNGNAQCSLEDVSSPPDGYLDLVCQFVDDFTEGWLIGDGTASVTGNLLDGTLISGSDSISIVP